MGSNGMKNVLVLVQVLTLKASNGVVLQRFSLGEATVNNVCTRERDGE